MDVFFVGSDGVAAEDFWSAANGWNDKALPQAGEPIVGTAGPIDGLRGTPSCLTVNGGNAIDSTLPAGTYAIVAGSCTGLTADSNHQLDVTGGLLVVLPVPTVTGLAPTSGPTTGGTSVTITGTDFTGSTSVSFGSVAAVSCVVNSNTSITAVCLRGGRAARRLGGDGRKGDRRRLLLIDSDSFR